MTDTTKPLESIAALVAANGPMHLGIDPSPAVRSLQIALSNAGYRVDITSGSFTADTDYWLRQFQKQHGFTVNGILDKDEAALLDTPPTEIIAAATPLVHVTGWPHDDTASLIAFYGDPREDNEGWQKANLVPVVSPWQMYAEDGGSPIKAIYFHRLCAPNLLASLQAIWTASGMNVEQIHAWGMHQFSGAYNFRTIRGSERLSDHAFGIAADFDSVHHPMNYQHLYPLPPPVYNAFKSNGAWMGQDFQHRQDPMHVQWAHE